MAKRDDAWWKWNAEYKPTVVRPAALAATRFQEKVADFDSRPRRASLSISTLHIIDEAVSNMFERPHAVIESGVCMYLLM